MQIITEKLEKLLKETESNMGMCCNFLVQEFSKIRTGRATVQILDSIKVLYYGSLSPIQQIASVTTPDASTIIIKPWEKKVISEIEKAIINSNLDLLPTNNGEHIVLKFTPMTEEKRRKIAKIAKDEAEKAKVSIRNLRKNAKDLIKKFEKEGLSEDEGKKSEEKLQKLTDLYILKVDNNYVVKEKDILQL